ncbi:hypothetical protein ABGT24_26275 [Peribacillus frigoritolerans]|uniref:hypothetical protein n=1 Tax=Peribacillus frigoritolerans TaxID=450367 RepID=UPI00345DC44E
MLQRIPHHSHPSVTVLYIGITEEETNEVLKTLVFFTEVLFQTEIASGVIDRLFHI